MSDDFGFNTPRIFDIYLLPVIFSSDCVFCSRASSRVNMRIVSAVTEHR